MTFMHNRRGSVLLMAIGMLTILAILASTFLVLSNLDSEETESLAVRAYADPIVDGLLAKAIAQMSYDRVVSAGSGPYGSMAVNADGLVSFMDYPHAYTKAEVADHWLSGSYVPGEGITGKLTNLIGLDGVAGCTGKTFAEVMNPKDIYPDGQQGDTDPKSQTPVYVCTDTDRIPDALLFDTGISSPLSDANTYWAGARIVDLGSRMCINTAAGWDSSESASDRPSGSAPDMVDLRTFLDKRSGTATVPAVYPLLNAGDNAVKGRIGDATASTKNYGLYCGTALLSPGKGYQPFGIGEEGFFLTACSYLDNMSQFAGRINQMIVSAMPKPPTNTPLPDNIRRQLTTMNCVSSLVRWPDLTAVPKVTEPLVIKTVQNEDDCKLVYDRMKLMLQATGVGKSDAARARMAAHFAANLWAYCSNTVGAAADAVGEPWRFTPPEGFTVYGLRQNMVITQVFARHIVNTQFDANDKDKDNSAWGFAVELANPSTNVVVVDKYELELKSDANTVIVPVWASGSKSLAGAGSADLTPKKRVVYGCIFGKTFLDKTTSTLFGEPVVAGTTWYQDNKVNLLAGAPRVSITLYKKVVDNKGNLERVPVDYVSVGTDGASDLEYDTTLRELNVRGDHANKKGPTATDKCIHVRRDDRLKTGAPVYRPARYNLAMYAISNTTAGTKIGKPNDIAADTELTRRSVYGAAGVLPTGRTAIYSPAIYRPRETAVSADGTARESMPSAEYFLPSLADMCNVYLAGPIRDGTDRPFTTEILRNDMSDAFADRLDIGRMPSAKLSVAVNKMTDVAFNAANARYPDVPPAYMFHEFFTRTPAHQARTNEKKRVYGMININTLALPQAATYNCAAWWLPWPTDSTSGSLAANTSNRLALGLNPLKYARDAAIANIRKYRDGDGDPALVDRSWVGITGLRNVAQTKIAGFMTPGEVGIPLAKYMDTLLAASSTEFEKDSDYIRARNCLFGYISDCLSTRSDMYACYITVQHGKSAGGRRWRYVAVIDRSNVINPTDKAALVLLTQLR